jgi:hypothetical protein
VALCEDAAVILRCLLNLLVVTRWIALRPDGPASNVSSTIRRFSSTDLRRLFA